MIIIVGFRHQAVSFLPPPQLVQQRLPQVPPSPRDGDPRPSVKVAWFDRSRGEAGDEEKKQQSSALHGQGQEWTGNRLQCDPVYIQDISRFPSFTAPIDFPGWKAGRCKARAGGASHGKRCLTQATQEDPGAGEASLKIYVEAGEASHKRDAGAGEARIKDQMLWTRSVLFFLQLFSFFWVCTQLCVQSRHIFNFCTILLI